MSANGIAALMSLFLSISVSKTAEGIWQVKLSAMWVNYLWRMHLWSLRMTPNAFVTLHRLSSASISRRMTFDLTKLPIPLGVRCCVLALLNIIPKFEKKPTSFCQIYHHNPAYLCVANVWLRRDTKCFFENFVSQKWRMWRIASKKMNGAKDFCLELVRLSDSGRYQSNSIKTFSWPNSHCVCRGVCSVANLFGLCNRSNLIMSPGQEICLKSMIDLYIIITAYIHVVSQKIHFDNSDLRRLLYSTLRFGYTIHHSSYAWGLCA